MNETKRYTRRQAIKDKCLDCCAGQIAEVRLCPATDCPLWRFRRGKEIVLETEPVGGAVSSVENNSLSDA